MAIESAGYDGDLFENDHAVMTTKYGADYWVDRPEDFKATTAAGDRTVTISAGMAGGRGIKDVQLLDDQVTFDAAPEGQRWDMVAIRRDWQPALGGPSSLVVVKGSATKALPGARQNQPAVVDEQPLYLQQIVGNVLGERVDLRVFFGNGYLLANDALVRSYLTTVPTKVRIGDTEWLLSPDSNGTASWSADIKPGMVAALTPVIDGWHDLRPYLKNGWEGSSDTSIPRWRRVDGPTGSYVEFRGQVVHPTSTGNSIMCYMGAPYRPKSTMYFGGLNARTSSNMGAVIGPDGIFTMWTEIQSGGLRSLNSIKYWLD